MPTPFNSSTAGAGTWTADFTGTALVMMWGGGGSGASGGALNRGGDGGGGGAMVVELVDVVLGTVYNFFIGAGGALTAYTSGGHVGNDGQASYWGDGSAILAAPGKGGTFNGTGGPGGAYADSRGRARVPGGNGGIPPSPQYFGGGKGGDAAGTVTYPGGLGGAEPGQNPGNPGSAKGGGGSGGGQQSGGTGGAGAQGGIHIEQTTTGSLPGYYLLGVDSAWTFDAAASYDDFIPGGDGLCWVECVGGGGPGKPGASANGGGQGGSGGAYAAKLMTVYKSVQYRRIVGAGGVGNAYNGATGTPGASSSFTLTPLRINKKQVAGNVATLWTSSPATSSTQKHGFEVGDSVTIAGVGSPYDGTRTVTAVAADRLSFSFALVNANLGPTTVTPVGTISRTNPLVLADHGLAATAYSTGAGVVAGGQASNSIGDVTVSGGPGQKTDGTLKGGNAGGGGLPLGDRGGWGGQTAFQSTPANPGDAGVVPGGGGGGGRNGTGGSGGNGARGAVVVRWILSLHGVVEDGVKKDIIRVRWKDTGGVVHTITDSSVVRAGAKVSTVRTKVHPGSRLRRPPTYLPAAYADRFDLASGTFNWKRGTPNLQAAIAANDLDMLWLGDSVCEGWTSYDGLVSGVKDFPHAFPRVARDLLAAAGVGLTLGGTGAIRPASVSGADPQWGTTGSWTSHVHYISSTSTTAVATFTPGTYSDETTQITGTRVAVVSSGAPLTVKIDGVTVGTTANTADSVLSRWESGALTDAAHVVTLTPTVSGTASNIFSCDVYKPLGVRCHNLAQGGAKAGGGTGQSFFGDTATAAPTNMTNCYSQQVMVKSSKGYADVVPIFLGGNDSNAGTDAATIKTAFNTIGGLMDHAHTDVVIMADVWTEDRQTALMDLCITNDWAMIDFFWFSRSLSAIFDQGYNGDSFGHLNSSGAAWVGAEVRDALLLGPH